MPNKFKCLIEDTMWWLMMLEIFCVNRILIESWKSANPFGRLLIVPIIAVIVWAVMIMMWVIVTGISVGIGIIVGAILLPFYIISKLFFKQVTHAK